MAKPQDELTTAGYTKRALYLRHIWARYRLSEDRWWRFWEDQGGRCAGCETQLAHPWITDMPPGLKLEVDHCHSQSLEDEFKQINLHYVRGLLCRRCNDFLGKIRDNQAALRRLADYLKRHGETLEDIK